MASSENRSAVLPAVIVGLCLVVGLALGGYFVGKGAMRFRSDSRVVTVKGLVEREVKADQAVWTLGLRRASESLQDAHTRISADRDAAVAFLRKQGFAEDRDRAAAHAHGGQARPGVRPAAGRRPVPLRGDDLGGGEDRQRGPGGDRARRHRGAAQGRRDPGRRARGRSANPRYVVSKFNDLRPQLLADATKNARATAQQFAADSGAQVGVIRSANQGSIQIFGTDRQRRVGARSARPALR